MSSKLQSICWQISKSLTETGFFATIAHHPTEMDNQPLLKVLHKTFDSVESLKK